MSQQESSVCAICGGIRRIDWTISFEECRPVEVRFEPESLADKWLCAGHSEPAHNHDGKLNEDGSYNVYPNNFGGIAIHANNGITWMEAKEALSLLDWLLQEKPTLQRLAMEQEHG